MYLRPVEFNRNKKDVAGYLHKQLFIIQFKYG